MTAPLKVSLLIDGDATGLKKAVGETNAAIGSIGSSATAAGTNVVDFGKRGAAGMALARHEVSNLSAQIADLGVQIAGGGSPFMAMIQQGPQIADILGGRGLTGIVAGVGQGLMSLVNPVTLFLAGITAAGYAASALFDAISGGAEDAKLSLEEQAELISRVAQKYGEATPAITAYSEALRQKKEIEERNSAVDVLNDKAFDIPRERVSDLNGRVAAVLGSLGMSGDPQVQKALDPVIASIGTLKQKMDEGTASAADAQRVSSALADLYKTRALPEVKELAAGYADLAAQTRKANEQQAANERDRPFQSGGPLRRGRYDPSTPDLPGTASIPSPRLDPLLHGDAEKTENAEAERYASIIQAAGRRPNDIERLDDEASATAKVASRTELLLASQRDRLELLRAEVGAAGQSEEARRGLIAGLETEQKIRSLGIPLYGEEANAMRANSAEIVRLTQERADGVKRAQDAEKEWSADRGLAKGILGDFAGALRDGASGWEVWAAAGERALDRIVDRLTDTAIDSLLDAWLPMPGGSPASSGVPAASTIGNVGQMLAGGGRFSASPLADRLPGAPRGSINVPYAVMDGQTFVGGQPVGGRGGMPSIADVSDYIRQAAVARGIDPGTALTVARSEGLGPGIWQSNYNKGGYREPSFGPFQLLKGGPGTGFGRGLGNNFQDATGLDPADPANTYPGIDFALNHAAKNGWGAWYGAAKAGVGRWEGLGGAQAAPVTAGMAEQAKSATKALEDLATGGKAAADASVEAAQGFAGAAGGMGKLAQQMMSVGGGAGGGGWFSSLMGLNGGAGGAINWMNAISPSVTAAIAGGAVGLFADGGWTGPGAKHQAKGVVHADEIVWSKADVARHGGVAVVEAMRQGARGYAEGGVVSAMPFSTPGMAGGGGAGAMGGLHVSVGVSVDKSGNLEAYVTGIAQEKSDAAAKREVKIYSAGSFGRHMQNDAQARQRIPGHAPTWR